MTNITELAQLRDRTVDYPYYLVECDCGKIYPSSELSGGEPMGDSGDYSDCYCPHCGEGEEHFAECADPETAWKAQQDKIDALVEALEKAQTERDEFRNRLKLERSILEDADKRIAELESRTVTAAAADVLAERQRQVTAEGWTAERDDGYQNSEQADAIGFRNGASCLIEAKCSRSDLLADRKKPFRVEPEKGMGDWRFMISEPGIVNIEDLQPGWGLLHVVKGRVEKVHGWPGNWEWVNRDSKPFQANKQAECDYMFSALRRMNLRGHLKEVYDGVIVNRAAEGANQ